MFCGMWLAFQYINDSKPFLSFLLDPNSWRTCWLNSWRALFVCLFDQTGWKACGYRKALWTNSQRIYPSQVSFLLIPRLSRKFSGLFCVFHLSRRLCSHQCWDRPVGVHRQGYKEKERKNGISFWKEIPSKMTELFTESDQILNRIFQ